MAATRLIALHIGKGKTAAKALQDRLDYSQNPGKTDDRMFFASLNWRKMQIKMENFASPFWRKLQAVSGGCKYHRNTTADMGF